MQELLRIKHDILAKGKVDCDHLAALRLALYVGGKVGREQADFLVELHKRVEHLNPGFEHLFYRAIKDHVLATGSVDIEETVWLRQMLFADHKITDDERKFLHELKGETGQMSLEFAALFVDAMKVPHDHHTSE
jgi:hypothetical protein